MPTPAWGWKFLSDIAISKLLDTKPASSPRISPFESRPTVSPATPEFLDGKRDGLRVAISALSSVLGIRTGEQHEAHIRDLDLPALDVLVQHLVTHRAWPPLPRRVSQPKAARPPLRSDDELTSQRTPTCSIATASSSRRGPLDA
jgi:hypothetical protein